MVSKTIIPLLRSYDLMILRSYDLTILRANDLTYKKLEDEHDELDATTKFKRGPPTLKPSSKEDWRYYQEGNCQEILKPSSKEGRRVKFSPNRPRFIHVSFHSFPCPRPYLSIAISVTISEVSPHLLYPSLHSSIKRSVTTSEFAHSSLHPSLWSFPRCSRILRCLAT